MSARRDTLMRQRSPWRYPWMPQFIAALKNSANVRASCQAANISRQFAYACRRESKYFSDQWDEAVEDALDILEAEAWTRARGGSDYLLWRLLAAYRREKFGESLSVKLDYQQALNDIASRSGAPRPWIDAKAREIAAKYPLRNGDSIIAEYEPVSSEPVQHGRVDSVKRSRSDS